MALKASPADQALLLDLQEFDTRLSQLDHRAKNIPEIATLQSLEMEVTRGRQDLARGTGALEDVRLELQRIEADVTVVESRIARDSQRMQASSSSKDVAALDHELTALRKRLDDLEEIELAVMERVEEAESAVRAAEASLAGVNGRIASVSAGKDESLQAIAADRSVAAAGRTSLASRIPAELLALYEKQRSRYGTGASLLRGGVSLASGVKLLENEMQEIRAAAPDDIIMCASSEAILVRTGDSGL